MSARDRARLLVRRSSRSSRPPALRPPGATPADDAAGAQLVSADYERLEQGDDSTVFAAISADGRYVAFQTRARNFFADDDPDPPGQYRAGRRLPLRPADAGAGESRRRRPLRRRRRKRKQRIPPPRRLEPVDQRRRPLRRLRHRRAGLRRRPTPTTTSTSTCATWRSRSAARAPTTSSPRATVATLRPATDRRRPVPGQRTGRRSLARRGDQRRWRQGGVPHRSPLRPAGRRRHRRPGRPDLRSRPRRRHDDAGHRETRPRNRRDDRRTGRRRARRGAQRRRHAPSPGPAATQRRRPASSAARTPTSTFFYYLWRRVARRAERRRPVGSPVSPTPTTRLARRRSTPSSTRPRPGPATGRSPTRSRTGPESSPSSRR